jgi:hypothetical protein
MRTHELEGVEPPSDEDQEVPMYTSSMLAKEGEGEG